MVITLIALLIGLASSAGIPRTVQHDLEQRAAYENSLGGEQAGVVQTGLSNLEMIHGRVVDRLGNPINGIDVVIVRSGKGLLRKTKTNREGSFSISAFPGTYEVFTKDKDGPTCPSCLFYSGGQPTPSVTTVTVLQGQRPSSLLLQTAGKSPKLTGRVFDVKTNEPIVTSRITLRRIDNPDYSLETGTDEDGNFIIPLPAVAVTIDVRAPGYKPWSYFDGALPLGHKEVTALKLRMGQSRKLEVGLRKLIF